MQCYLRREQLQIWWFLKQTSLAFILNRIAIYCRNPNSAPHFGTLQKWSSSRNWDRRWNDAMWTLSAGFLKDAGIEFEQHSIGETTRSKIRHYRRNTHVKVRKRLYFKIHGDLFWLKNAVMYSSAAASKQLFYICKHLIQSKRNLIGNKLLFSKQRIRVRPQALLHSSIQILSIPKSIWVMFAQSHNLEYSVCSKYRWGSWKWRTNNLRWDQRWTHRKEIDAPNCSDDS